MAAWQAVCIGTPLATRRAAIAGAIYPFLFGQAEELADRPVRDERLDLEERNRA